jgi:hypothetical protein
VPVEGAVVVEFEEIIGRRTARDKGKTRVLETAGYGSL